MIAYSMVGTNNLEASGKFYDAIFTPMGAERTWEADKFIAWGIRELGPTPSFSITAPYNGEKATVGNGSMTSFAASSPEMVNEIYRLAIENGGSDEGEPGYRGDPAFGFYAGYFRDPDGNKCNAFCMAPQK
ncbi:VOC family protein [Kordiimonas sp. SCSIO 12610]|uniref:VOC family protein n=1 Tax=Kordiimonas sp. SCSIO 12610 TaxID=2829597 RepID=UPI00210BB190|nr:VOC family protein [Kordiimonas sp. SCSIO 12610]UTW56676.1 VOC family protein [Kordiimonas sp. SCSIO 12610]